MFLIQWLSFSISSALESDDAESRLLAAAMSLSL